MGRDQDKDEAPPHRAGEGGVCAGEGTRTAVARSTAVSMETEAS